MLADDGAEENLLLGENPEFRELGRFPVDGFAEVNHPNLLFLRRNAEWPSIITSLSSLPFVETTNTQDEPPQLVLRLAPGFRHWLQTEIRGDPVADAEWSITAVLLLHRFTLSPLIKGWLSSINGRKSVVKQDQHIHHVLGNLLRVCESLQEQDFVLLPPPQRLCCVIFYINWNGMAMHTGQHDIRNKRLLKSQEPQGCQTESLMAKLADIYWMDPLIQAIVKAEEFLRDSSIIAKSPKSYDEWVRSANELIMVLETLSEDGGTVSASQTPLIAVDTLMALIFALTPLSNRNIQYGPVMYHKDRSIRGKRVLTLLAQQERIRQEAHRFRTHLPPPSNDYERVCAVSLSHWFYTKSCCEHKSHIGKYMQENFSFAMDFLPIPLAFVYLTDMLSHFLDNIHSTYGPRAVNFNQSYCWALAETFRVRPDVIYRERKDCLMVTDAPNNRQILNHLERISYDLMKPLLKSPIRMHLAPVEAIAAHHFLITGNFPKITSGVLHTTRWAPISYGFHLLSLIYFNAGEFREAAVLANAYLSLIRVQTPLSWIPHLHHCIRILVHSLRDLGLLSPFNSSPVGQHVDNLLFDRLSHEETDVLTSTWVWEVIEPVDKTRRFHTDVTENHDGRKHTIPWNPESETTSDINGVEDTEPVNHIHHNPVFYKQMRGWFQLIDKDDVLRDARRQLLRSRSDIIERIFAANGRLGIETEKIIKGIHHLQLLIFQ